MFGLLHVDQNKSCRYMEMFLCIIHQVTFFQKCFSCYSLITENAEKWQNCNLRPCHDCRSSWFLYMHLKAVSHISGKAEVSFPLYITNYDFTRPCHYICVMVWEVTRSTGCFPVKQDISLLTKTLIYFN